MMKKHFSIIAVITALLLVSTNFFSQGYSQVEEEGVHVTKIFTHNTEPGFASVSTLICAGNESISNPEIIISSDKETKMITVNGVVPENNCRGETVLLEVNNLSSFSGSFVNLSGPLLMDELSTDSKNEVVIQGIVSNNFIKIPYWFSNTMNWYLEGSVSEKELTSAMKYLVNEEIIYLV